MGNDILKNENLNSEQNDEEKQKTVGIGEIKKKGLANIGNSSFINSTIQCLSNCREFAKMFIEEKNSKLLETNPLLQNLYNIILYLYSEDQNPKINDILKEFKQHLIQQLPKYNERINLESQGFLLDLLNIINQFSNDQINNLPENWKYSEDISQLQFKDQLIKESWDNHIKANASKINELFRGLVTCETNCTQCEISEMNSTQTNEPFFLLEVPIPEILLINIKIIYLDKGSIERNVINIKIYGYIITTKQLISICKPQINETILNQSSDIFILEILGKECRNISVRILRDNEIIDFSNLIEQPNKNDKIISTKELFVVVAQHYIPRNKDKKHGNTLHNIYSDKNLNKQETNAQSNNNNNQSNEVESVDKYIIVIPFKCIDKDFMVCSGGQNYSTSFEGSNYPFVFTVTVSNQPNNAINGKDLLFFIGSKLHPKMELSDYWSNKHRKRWEFYFLNQLQSGKYDEYYDEQNVENELQKFFVSKKRKSFYMFFEETRDNGIIFEPTTPTLDFTKQLNIDICLNAWKNIQEKKICEKCKFNLQYKRALSKLPKYLCIYLKKQIENNNNKNNREISLSEEINILPYTISSIIEDEENQKFVLNEQDCKYKLIAINQISKSLFRDYYITFMKLNDNKWYLFDDKKVREVSLTEIPTDKTIFVLYEQMNALNEVNKEKIFEN